ncbi:MAG: hypothetical protein CSA21_04140 [Deltaproteobacteria bacterium]|nr:MAG: hypothetical protein CSA21_04140 [Deltaproteobacteria bacterium]
MTMLKKIAVTMMASAVFTVPAMAIEPPQGVEIPWQGPSTAYTSRLFNNILEAYGLQLSTEAVAHVPASYASVVDGKVKFNNKAIAYKPAKYHAILTSYGLELSPQEVAAKLGTNSYASVKDGKVVFGKVVTAYNGNEWKTILSAYNLPAPPPMAVAPAKQVIGDSDGDGVTDDKDACPGTPKGVQVDERGCWSHSSHLLFDFDKADIKPAYQPVLDEAKLVFDAYPSMKVEIEGYTDSTGPEAYNQKLSERRAKAVMDYLTTKAGISADRLSIIGYGENKPAYPNDSKENRAKNRRVQFNPMM